MSIQTITSPSGEKLIVLSQQEYERLVDAADIAAADRVRRNIDAGTDELLPAEMVKQMIEGESPLKLWRKHRGMSSKLLAERAGISPAYLSQIENGKKAGRLNVLKSLADALSVTLDDLVLD